MFYAFVRAVVGFAIRLFYRVRVRGARIEDEGPLMFVGNHPNALIDPALVFVVSRRHVTFLAKEPLFRTPGMGALLRGLGALPVFRKQDNAQMSGNEGTFEAATRALVGGGAITIFPEGKSHSEPGLAELKTGAARIAFRACRQGAPVRIVPVGLTYEQKHRFRSEVLIEIGPAIDARGFLPETEAEDAARVRALTEQIAAGLKQVTLNLEEWSDLPLVKMAEELYAFRLGEQARDPERVRRFAKGVQLFRSEQPERFEQLRDELVSFSRRLSLLRADTGDLAVVYRRDQVAWFALKNLAAVLLGFPIFAVGLVVFALPFYLPRWINRARQFELDVQATVKFIAALVLAPLVMVGIGALVAWRWGLGWGALAIGLSLPLALFTRYFLERFRSVWHDVQVFFTLGGRARLKTRLLVEGERLAAEVERVAQELRPRVDAEISGPRAIAAQR